jgi:hypothetical protein
VVHFSNWTTPLINSLLDMQTGDLLHVITLIPSLIIMNGGVVRDLQDFCVRAIKSGMG